MVQPAKVGAPGSPLRRYDVRVVDRDLDARRFVGISLTGPGPVIAVMYALRAAIAEVTLAFCAGCILAGERLLVGLLG